MLLHVPRGNKLLRYSLLSILFSVLIYNQKVCYKKYFFKKTLRKVDVLSVKDLSDKTSSGYARKNVDFVLRIVFFNPELIIINTYKIDSKYVKRTQKLLGQLAIPFKIINEHHEKKISRKEKYCRGFLRNQRLCFDWDIKKESVLSLALVDGKTFYLEMNE